VRSLSCGNEKSCDRTVVASCQLVDPVPDKIMKTKEQNFRQTLRQIFRRRLRRHDPMLVFNMWSFNFTDGWSRIFAREQYGRFSV
jgi:hypothetical protein